MKGLLLCLFYSCVPTVDSEDGVAIEAPGTLNLDAEFLLGHDLEFDHDGKILNLDKFSGASWPLISLVELQGNSPGPVAKAWAGHSSGMSAFTGLWARRCSSQGLSQR